MGNKKILLIEEDFSTRKAIAEFLRKNGTYEVVQAADDMGGIRAFVAEIPAVVVLDIDMKGAKDGLMGFIARNKKPFVVIGNERMESLARAAGCAIYLKKPVHMLQLQEAVEKIFRQINFTIYR